MFDICMVLRAMIKAQMLKDHAILKGKWAYFQIKDQYTETFAKHGFFIDTNYKGDRYVADGQYWIKNYTTPEFEWLYADEIAYM